MIPVAARERSLLFKGPEAEWGRGVILVLHGGGGQAAHFCSGGRLVKPQVNFTREALARGFAVILLESTGDAVTDEQGRACGKRFDFSVLDRPNVDLPYIRQVLDDFIPSTRPGKSSEAVFLAGLSTGGYMTLRAAAQFDDRITAFAAISAGDPFGTDTVCDPDLNRRRSAIGTLVDRETGRSINEVDACAAPDHPNESPWESNHPDVKPAFRLFHDASDGIVDVSCMKKVESLLGQQGFVNGGTMLLPSSGRRTVFRHLWQDAYNEPILDFFDDERPGPN